MSGKNHISIALSWPGAMETVAVGQILRCSVGFEWVSAPLQCARS